MRFYYDNLTLDVGTKFGTGATVNAPATIRVLKYVYIPATKTGYRYDYNASFGIISKINRYVGMTASSTSLTASGSITSDGLFAASTEYNYETVPQNGLTDVPNTIAAPTLGRATRRRRSRTIR